MVVFHELNVIGELKCFKIRRKKFERFYSRWLLIFSFFFVLILMNVYYWYIYACLLWGGFIYTHFGSDRVTFISFAERKNVDLCSSNNLCSIVDIIWCSSIPFSIIYECNICVRTLDRWPSLPLLLLLQFFLRLVLLFRFSLPGFMHAYN